MRAERSASQKKHGLPHFLTACPGDKADTDEAVKHKSYVVPVSSYQVDHESEARVALLLFFCTTTGEEKNFMIIIYLILKLLSPPP